MKRTPLARKTPLRAKKPAARTRSELRATPTRRKSPARSHQAKNTGSRVPPEVVDAVKRRSGGWCERCTTLGRRTPGTELHHRVPRSRGGPDDVRNLVDLCQSCHHDKAHGQNEHPWLIRGYFIRGVYTGPEQEYRENYPAA